MRVKDELGKEVLFANGSLLIDVINLDPQGRTTITLDRNSTRALAEAMLEWASEAIAPSTHHSFEANELVVDQPKLKI